MRKKIPWPIALAELHPAKRLKLYELDRFFRNRNRYGDCLDVGCGTGGVAFRLRSYGNGWAYVENDDTARKTAEMALGCPVAGNITAMENRKFDLITLIDTVFYLDKPDRHLRLFKELLKPGGELLIVMVDGDPLRFVNKCRERFHIGRVNRGFRYQERTADFRRRVSGLGFEESYFREFSFVLDEVVLFFLDVLKALQSGMARLTPSSGVSPLLESKPVSLGTLFFLYCFRFLSYAITIVQLPLKPWCRGARFIMAVKAR